jgi:predicted RNA binding protein YcfA (HicA-like mRNA interferase family)
LSVPKIPRNISGKKLVKILFKIGYRETRRSSTHIRLSKKNSHNLEHHITIPDHNNIKIGTLNNIINDLANHLKIEKKMLIEELFK